MSIKWNIVFLSSLLFLIMASTASAQLSTSGGAVDISADTLEVIDSKNIAIYRGHVDVIQDDARLQADEIRVQFAKGATDSTGGALSASWGDIQTITATGNVFYTTPGEVARGDKAVYRVTPDTITLTGDVIVTQDGNVIRAQLLVIKVKTGEASFEAGEIGRKSRDRVRSVFFPKKTD
ncbi:MAG: hypothetical protein L3J04_07550 [Robiginitomaculum sp.]|nr:hypothetical protein [Robiginitomaculum sp.]